MEGGHDVPISKIISRYYRSIALCIQALPGLDRAYFYDNSVSEADPRLLFRANEGKLAKVYEESVSWAEEIMQSLT
jgi:predicted ABC-type ATPase